MSRGCTPRGTARTVEDWEEFSDELGVFLDRLCAEYGVPPLLAETFLAHRFAPRLRRTQQTDIRYALAASWMHPDPDPSPDTITPTRRTSLLMTDYLAVYGTPVQDVPADIA